MTETDWKATARKWEARAKENRDEADALREKLERATPSHLVADELRRTREQLTTEKEKARSWRSAFHALRIALEGRLDRIEQQLDLTEWVDEDRKDQEA
jgi:hypothetical protein